MSAHEQSTTARADPRPRVPSWRDVLGIDLRALAVLRVGLGLALLADLALRATDLVAHYTDLGVFPRSLLMQRNPLLAPISLHFHASGHPEAVAGLFLLHAAFALALLLGWRTRLFTFLCWIFLVSLQRRMPVMIHGGDQLLSMLLFWSLFLPLGARYSLDARRAGEPTRGIVFSVASAAMLLQVAMVYWVPLLVRTTSPVWWEGDALYYVLQLDFWATRTGLLLRELEFLHEPLTYLTLLIEAGGPLLCFVPRWAAWGRPLAFLLFLGLHIGFGLFISLGTFPYVSVLSWVVFLPPWVWDRLEGTRRTGARGGPRLRARPAVEVVAAVCLGLVLVMNLKSGKLPFSTDFVPQPLVSAARHLHLQQPWRMFAPKPPLVDAWFLFEGVMPDGRRVDLLNGGPSRPLRRPDLVSDVFPSHRWQILLFWARAQRHHRALGPMAEYFCRRGRWPAHADTVPERLVHVWLFREKAPPPGRSLSPPKVTRVLTLECGGEAQEREGAPGVAR